MTGKRLAIVTTHPIQYNAPLFKIMNEQGPDLAIKVFYTWSQSKDEVFDKDFGISVDWDIPLLQGYDYTFVTNISSKPGSHHFKGIINPTLNQEIEEWRADAILIFGWSFLSHLQAMRHFHGRIPVLFRGDSTLIDEPGTFSLKRIARRASLLWVYRHINYALYVGTANKNYFIAHGLKKNQLLFAPHAVDNHRFSSNDSDYNRQAKRWRADLGIPDSDIVFLFAAKLTLKKDPELLIRSFLSLNCPSSRVVIVGNGELERGLKEKYKNTPQVIFLDFQNQTVMPVVYRLGDVFVLPSQGPGETWGLAANEAMACGRGIIVSDKCGCGADLVSQGKTGYVFRHRSEKSLVECMRLALNNFKELGANARSEIENWTYTKFALQMKFLFDNIV